MTVRIIFYFALLLSLFQSCKDNNKKDSTVIQGFSDSLIEKPVGQLSYSISIPTNYEIKEEEGPDFSVFYFANADTTVVTGFSGGIYFGNFPSEFPPKNDSCKIETIDSPILGKNSTWTVYACDGEFAIQTIAESKSGAGWNNQIHAFGHGKSKEDLYKMLAIYSTLRKKELTVFIQA